MNDSRDPISPQTNYAYALFPMLNVELSVILHLKATNQAIGIIQ